jgi:tellurite resistance protein TerC
MISATTWIVTISILALVILLDLWLAILRRNLPTSLLEAGVWTVVYIGAALVFGFFMLPLFANQQAQQEFFAGWLTEYALSVDNIFVFIIILGHLHVKKEKQQLVLLLGIMLTILMRGALIPLGGALISRFESIFFLFGAFLLYTAFKLFKESGNEEEWQEGRIVARMRTRGVSTFSIALVALGLTNLVFSLDSIPAIFGLTKNVYIVTTANIFALMGLRQLYFLLESLLKRLVFLSKGLSIILAFIGLKMIFEASNAVGVHKILGVEVPEFSLTFSLGTIITCLIITTVASLTATRGIAGAE